MLIQYKRGQTSIILRVKILNSSVSTGAGLTGLLFSSTGLRIGTIADNEAATTSYTAAGSTTETITTLGTFAAPTATKCRFKEVDATSHPGVYEIQIADARFAVASCKSVLISISGATNAAECDVLIPLRDLDPYDSVRAGLTALPNAAAEAAGGLYTRGTGAGQINQDANGRVDANVKTWISGVIPAVSVTGVPLVDAKYLLGTVFPTPTVAGIPNVNVKTWNDLTTVALPLVPTAGRTLVVDVAGLADANVVKLGPTGAGTAQTARDIGTSVLLSSGTGTGQISLTSGKVALSNPAGLQKNVAVSNFTFLLVSATDHATPKTGATVTAQRSLDGAAFANCANAVAEIANGFYKIDLAAADLNADIVALKFTATGADQLSITIVTEP